MATTPTTQSAQGSITIKRLRTGNNLFIRLETNGKPLFQAVNKETGTCVPDWTQSANQPIITPVVSTLRNSSSTSVQYQSGSLKWKYNGVELTFNGAMSGTWQTDATGKFQMQMDTTATDYGAIKIIANLASTGNTAADTLTFSVVAIVEGVEYAIEKDIDILIQPSGNSSYVGTVTATTTQLEEGKTTQSTLTAILYMDGGNNFTEVEEYWVRWWWDDTLDTNWNGHHDSTSSGDGVSITIGRGDVNATQLLIAEFATDSAFSNIRYRQSIRITDISDEYYVDLHITSQNKEVSDDNSVDVEAYLGKINVEGKQSITGSWRIDVMKKTGWTIIRSVNNTGDSITVTIDKSDTDRDGHQDDVEVLAEVTF